jgi:hypothetical protein
MNVEIETVAAQFLSWEYFFEFSALVLCSVMYTWHSILSGMRCRLVVVYIKYIKKAEAFFVPLLSYLAKISAGREHR